MIVREELKTLAGWVRRRLRCYILRQWRWGRVMYQELLRRDVDSWFVTQVARHADSYWHNSKATALQFGIPIRFFDERGLPRLAA